MNHDDWKTILLAIIGAITTIYLEIIRQKQGRTVEMATRAATKAAGLEIKVEQAKKELSVNTEITRVAAEDLKTVKKLVNGAQVERDKRVDELQAKMEAHGIDCTPHGDKPT